MTTNSSFRPLLRTSVPCSATLLFALLGHGCSSDKKGFAAPPRTEFGLDAGTSPEPTECTTVKCSRDLKRVVSGCDESIVVKECATGLGCADGACIEDACRSAELAKGSVGCSFYTLPPTERLYGSDMCFAAIIANTWDLPVTVTAELGSEPLDISKSIYIAEKDGLNTVHERLEGPIPPGAVALVFLSQGPGADTDGWCPTGVVPALTENPISRFSGYTRAFRLKTDLPVSAYSIYPYGGAATFLPTATLLLPTSAWTTSYIAIDGWPGAAAEQKPFLQIVAQDDDTEVRMRPVANIEDGEGLTGGAAGQTQVWKLSRGQVLQLTQLASLAGSPLESTKPIGLFGGTQCTTIPNADVGYCDTLQQQIPPLAQWGSEYALVPYRSRLDDGGDDAILANESVPYRLVGAADGTKLSYDPYTPSGAPETLSAGQVVTFMSSSFVTVKSQDNEHPFYASVFMTGSLYNGTQTVGDPDFVNIVPSDQFLDRYVFSTDHTYPDTYITLVRKKTSAGFMPVELDCAGEVTGWKALDSKGDYEYLFMRLTRWFAPQTFGASSSSCGYGRHEAKSTGPFSITVWGLGQTASYGYPGGMGLRPVNAVHAPVPH